MDTADLAPDAAVAAAEARGEQPRTFIIDNAAALTEGGWTAKLDDNPAAIRLLKALELEGHMATDAEQASSRTVSGGFPVQIRSIGRTPRPGRSRVSERP